MAGAPHHKGRRYTLTAARLRHLAARNPDAICCICGRTPTDHILERPDGDNRWHACHMIPGSEHWQPWWDVTSQPPPGGDWLAAGIARCNIRQSNDDRRGIRDEIHSASW